MAFAKWIPNFLTSLRIVLAAGFPFLPEWLRAPVLVMALASEYLDGALARRFNWTSLTGQLLDPIADKLLTLMAGLTFILTGKLTLVQLVFISARDIVAAGGFVILVILLRNFSNLVDFRPLRSGKLTTVFQYLVFLDLALAKTPHSWLILLTGLLSVVSAVIYSLNFRFTHR